MGSAVQSLAAYRLGGKMDKINFGNTYNSFYSSVVDIFEKTVSECGNQIAARYKDNAMTYKQLNAKANAIAELVAYYTHEKNPVVGIMIDRSLNSLITMIGIIKAGAVFLPLDGKQPEERVKYILKNSGAEILIKASNNDIVVVPENGDYITLNINFKLLPDANNIEINIGADSLAYIIYTSGTTGKPKGVKVTHKNLANFSLWLAAYGNMGKETKMLHMFSIIFDASIIETFPCLISGGMVRILDDTEKTDPQLLLEEIEGAQTLMIPSFFRAIFEYAKASGKVHILENFDKLYFGAEALPEDLMKEIYKIMPHKLNSVYNLYGPTECTVAATAYQFTETSDLDNITIGRPINNTEIYILKDNKMCDIGETGEIIIGGRGVTAGYVNNEILTKEKFIYVPEISESRLYKTGDIGYWLEDGNIKLIGRNDAQVKINGYRIELGEIEQSLRKIDKINDALVLYSNDEKGMLFAAFCVAQSKLDEENIKKELSNYIPQYMIPNNIYQLEEFPYTVGGKLDRHKLIEEYKSKVEDSGDDVVMAIFRKVLNVTKVLTSDDFFEMGGDSIKAIQIVSALRRKGYELKVREILEGRKIDKILERVKKKTVQIEYSQEEITGEFSLSPIQKVFFNVMRINNPNYFNQSYMLETDEVIDIDAVKYSLDRITLHHDLLRSVYLEKSQKILPFCKGTHYGLDIFDIDNGNIEEFILKKTEEIERSINIKTGPLMRIGIFRGKKMNYLFFCIHHLAIDGISWRILIDDFLNCYHGFIEKAEYCLPQKSISFKEWSEDIWEYADSKELHREIAYWKSVNNKIKNGKFAGKNVNNEFELSMLEADMDSEHTKHMLYSISDAFNTEINDILLAALVRAASKKSGNSTIAINLEGHGREPIHKEAYTDRTVGWFTTEYPVVFENVGNESSRDLITVKETLRAIPNKGLGYIILQNTYPDMFTSIDPDITFNYLGEFGQEGNYGFCISEIKKSRDKDITNAFRTPITINSMIINKKYHMEVTYENNIFSGEYIEELIHYFLAELENIIEMCKGINEPIKTPSDYGETGWNFEELQYVTRKYEKIGKKIVAINELTPMQESMLYHKRLYPNSSEYTVQVDLSVNEDIHIETLYKALNHLAENHGSLRANIIYTGVNEPREVVLDRVVYESMVYDYSMEENSDHMIEVIKKQEIHRGFDLENETLLRIIVCTQADGMRVIITFHHIILDGWSCMLFIRKLFETYERLLAGSRTDSKYENIQGEYGKYIKQKDKRAAYEYWKELLFNYTEPCTIKAMECPNKVNKDIPGKVEIYLDSDLKERLIKFTHNYALSINTVIETVWGLILGVYTRKDDIVFGKVVSGRNVDITEINDSLGMYINTIPVRVILNYEEKLIHLLEKVHLQSATANDYDFCSLEEIQQMTPIKNKLLGSAISFENYQESPGSQIFRINQVRELSSFPISVSAQTGKQFILSFLYDAAIYGKNEMTMLLERFVDILKQVIINPDRKVRELSFITLKEEEMIRKFNDNKAVYPLESNIVALFKEQVKRTPDHIALKFHDDTMTYKEMDEKAISLANKLIISGIGENRIVPIIVKPCIEMVIGIFGVLETGAAYLPIDPEMPEERIKYMLEQVGSETVLTTSDHDIPRVKKVIYIDRVEGDIKDDDCISIDSNDNAYVIFTSGTTGTPKGVVITHRNLINHTCWQIENSRYNESVTMVQTISFTFDGHASEVYPVLLSGGTLVIADEMQRKDPKELLKLMEGNRITFIPSLLREVIRYAEESRQTCMLRKFDKMYIAAEPIMKMEILKMLGNNRSKMKDIYHFYGPTEATITTVAINLSDVEDEGIVPIGRPIANTEVYILDNNQNMCGIGIPGEICLGGASISKGYMKNDNLTEEKFVSLGNKRIYCTGDIGYWDEKGLLHFIGRKDDQIKIRGFRVELQEIVSMLRKCKGIEDAAVVVQEVNGDKAICAYIILAKGHRTDNVKEQLATFLPEYMMPQYYIEMKTLPTTANGKIDKRALPCPANINVQNKIISAPKTETERRVAKLFKKVLDVNDVDVNDSFYSLGGHSLKMTRLLNEIEKDFGVRLSLKAVMEAKTVRKVSCLIDEGSGIEKKNIAAISVAKPLN